MFASIVDLNGWAVLGGCIVMITIITFSFQRSIDGLKKSSTT
jgi:hypothetical protein